MNVIFLIFVGIGVSNYGEGQVKMLDLDKKCPISLTLRKQYFQFAPKAGFLPQGGRRVPP